MRALLLVLFVTATALACRTGGGLQAAAPAPGPFHLGPNEWVQRTPGHRCSADAQRSAFGCTITRCTESGPPDGGDGEYTQGYGKVSAACGESVEVCGEAYRCECETCSDVPDYSTRMTRKRDAVFTPPDDEHGIILFAVSYEGGKCEGVGNPHYGDEKLCHVSAWDDSQVGGCYRHTNDPRSDPFPCGESVTVCGGVGIRCECLDGGVQRLGVLGARLAVPKACPEK